MFKIRDYVEFDSKGRGICPCCASNGKEDRTLSIVPGTDGAYKCHRGCTTEDIRTILGVAKFRQIPQALAQPSSPSKPVTVSPQKVREAHERLIINPNQPAMQWLHSRGITNEMIARYQLGLSRAKAGDRHLPAVTIPLPNKDGTAYYQKKRVAPWLPASERPPQYKKWSQFQIPATVWFTWLPVEATQTWLCEGEWDAIVLGWMARQAEQPVAVATFTCGCKTVPPHEQLELMPGEVIIFYDRNDEPLKNGTRPGDEGAKKVAAHLGDRARIAQVPMASDCQIQGWDVSDAIKAGFGLQDFITAASEAVTFEPEPELPKSSNPLRDRLVTNDELLARAPDYTDWLVPDLLTSNELFLLAASPRAGKSLMSMTLAHAVAGGHKFLGRPVTQGAVLYIRCEDSEGKTKEREVAQGWSEGLPVYWINRFKLSEVGHLRELADELGVVLIVIDTLSRVRNDSVSESSSEMSNVLEPLQEMAEELNCCILIVHHTGKVNLNNAGDIDVFDTIRGSSAIRGVCRGTLVLAAGERNYRLCAENGWGKHDLNIVLDANTLTWRLLGNWTPTINGGQQDQILEYLKQVQSASIEQIHEHTGIAKMSLYKALERLQASDIAAEQVIKEGRRRSFVYRLALFDKVQSLNQLSDQTGTSDVCQFDHPQNDPDQTVTEKIVCQLDQTSQSPKKAKMASKPDAALDTALFDTIGQSNSLSNSGNPDPDSDRGLYLTKNSFSLSSDQVISDQTGTCDALITPAPNDHLFAEEEVVKYSQKQASNTDVASVSPIGQLFDSNMSESQDADPASVSPIGQDIGQLFDNPIQPGCTVRKRGRQGWRGRVVRLVGEGYLYALVHWVGDRRACRELLEDLELVEEGGQNDA